MPRQLHQNQRPRIECDARARGGGDQAGSKNAVDLAQKDELFAPRLGPRTLLPPRRLPDELVHAAKVVTSAGSSIKGRGVHSSSARRQTKGAFVQCSAKTRAARALWSFFDKYQ